MIQAWHFVGDTLRDGRPVPVDGAWLVHDSPIVMCKSGLHASVDVWDALKYAPGPVLCRVDVDGVLDDDDKIVGSRRRIVARVDFTDDLRAFACDEALRVAHLWSMPSVVRQYLTTRDESARVEARDAAWVAARDAAWAARYAARDAAWAAGDAACDATWDAACDAARYAACATAWAAGDAACDATWDAACDAPKAASADRFRAMVQKRFA